MNSMTEISDGLLAVSFNDVMDAEETTNTVVSEESTDEKQEEKYPSQEELLTTITAIGNICGVYEWLKIAYKSQETREKFRVESILDTNEGFKQVYNRYVEKTGVKDFPEALKEYIKLANEKHTPYFQFRIQDSRTKQHHVYKSDGYFPPRVYHITEEDPRDALTFCFYRPFGDEKYAKVVRKDLQREYKKMERKRRWYY